MRDPKEPVKIKIKCPNFQKDLKLEVDLGINVLQLKTVISLTHPGKPSPTTQKLLYFGKVLSDEVILKNVLKCEETFVSVIHLSIKQSSEFKDYFNPNEQNDLVRPILDGHSNLRLEAYNNYLIQWQRFLDSVYNANSGNEYLDFNFLEQENEYMYHLMYFYNNGFMQEEQADIQYVGDQPLNIDAREEQIVQEENPDIVLAHGGNESILDWLHMLSRIAILTAIIYYYSNFTRFFVVSGFVCLFYLYKTGILGGRRGQDEVIRGEVDRLRNFRQDFRIGANGQQQDFDQNIEAEDNIYEIQRNRINVAWDMISMFFISLLPEIGQNL